MGNDAAPVQLRRKFLVLLLVVATLVWGWLAHLSHATPPPSVWWLIGAMGVEWTIFLVVLGVPSLRNAITVRHVIVVALAFRACGLIATPLFEDDHHRFLWDGFVFAQTGDPYGTTPADWFGEPDVPESLQSTLDQVNHPDVPTIYGPATQAAFLLSHKIAPGGLWAWKLLLILSECALLYFLARLAVRTATVNALAFAAWCPLGVFETAFNAHPDALGVTLLMGAVVARRLGHDRWLGVCCGAAIGAKVFAVLVVPFLLWRRSPGAWLACAATLLALYLPFWLQGTTADFAGLRVFARDWEFNSSIHAILQWVLGPGAARTVALFAFGLIWIGLFQFWRTNANRTSQSLPPAVCVFAGFFLLSPTFNPWYALWLLPFVALRPTPTGIALLSAVSLSYLTKQNLGEGGLDAFNHPWWVRPLEFGIIGVVFLVETWTLRRSNSRRAG